MSTACQYLTDVSEAQWEVLQLLEAIRKHELAKE
jgi:hypothetical protein